MEEGKTNFGAANEPFTHILPVSYAEGTKHGPRVSSIDRFVLPSARNVSLQMKEWSRIDDEEEDKRNSDDFTLLVMQMGQFLDHDVVKTPAHPSKSTNMLLTSQKRHKSKPL